MNIYWICWTLLHSSGCSLYSHPSSLYDAVLLWTFYIPETLKTMKFFTKEKRQKSYYEWHIILKTVLWNFPLLEWRNISFDPIVTFHHLQTLVHGNIWDAKYIKTREVLVSLLENYGNQHFLRKINPPAS